MIRVFAWRLESTVLGTLSLSPSLPPSLSLSLARAHAHSFNLTPKKKKSATIKKLWLSSLSMPRRRSRSRSTRRESHPKRGQRPPMTLRHRAQHVRQSISRSVSKRSRHTKSRSNDVVPHKLRGRGTRRAVRYSGTRDVQNCNSRRHYDTNHNTQYNYGRGVSKQTLFRHAEGARDVSPNDAIEAYNDFITNDNVNDQDKTFVNTYLRTFLNVFQEAVYFDEIIHIDRALPNPVVVNINQQEYKQSKINLMNLCMRWSFASAEHVTSKNSMKIKCVVTHDIEDVGVTLMSLIEVACHLANSHSIPSFLHVVIAIHEIPVWTKDYVRRLIAFHHSNVHISVPKNTENCALSWLRENQFVPIHSSSDSWMTTYKHEYTNTPSHTAVTLM